MLKRSSPEGNVNLEISTPKQLSSNPHRQPLDAIASFQNLVEPLSIFPLWKSQNGREIKGESEYLSAVSRLLH